MRPQGPQQHVQTGQQQQQPEMWGLAADLAANADAGSMQVPHSQGSFPEFRMEQEPGARHHQQTASSIFRPQLGLAQPPKPSITFHGARLNTATMVAPGMATAFGLSGGVDSAIGEHATKLNTSVQQPRMQGAGTVQGIIRNTAGAEEPAPYGLVLELAQGGPMNPLHIHRGTAAPHQSANTAGAKRALGQQLADAGWSEPQQHQQQRGGHPKTAARPQSATPIHAGAVMPEEEPEYGIVMELKGAASRGFGLAAEVARRRTGNPGPFDGRQPSSGGTVLPPLRPRKRLAAHGPPAEFLLSQELAERQAALERDPFNAANRASACDPFVMAADVVRFPKAPFQLQHPHGQEMVYGMVPLKVPPEGDTATDAVLGDNNMYGLASELGAEEAWQRQQLEQAAMLQGASEQPEPLTAEEERQRFVELLEWEPLRQKYIYNEETGMLHTMEKADGSGGRKAKEFIEDAATGRFYRLNKPGLWRRMGLRFKRKDALTEEEWEPQETGCRAGWQTFFFHVANMFSCLGILMQGLLGGFAVLNFFLGYIVFTARYDGFMEYYAALASAFARLYYTLITISVISSTARLCRDELRGFEPKRLWLRFVDWGQMVCYVLAYFATVVCTPFDEHLTYEYNRNHQFYRLEFNSQFKTKVAVFHALNVLRTGFSSTGFALFCYQYCPAVSGAVIKYMTRQRMEAILVPRLIFDTSMAMHPQTPPSKRQTTAEQSMGGQSRQAWGSTDEGASAGVARSVPSSSPAGSQAGRPSARINMLAGSATVAGAHS